MTKRIAIEVNGISKRYTIGAENHWTLVDTLGAWSHKLLRKRIRDQIAPRSEFWALNDVSFDVAEGETVGIIGRNGAGKSTLLKILSRITYPTKGEIRYRGRIGSLLEVGTGFHPQLSGRDNIFLSGAVLGMRQREIARKFDEIVDFSGVERFIDTPVKRYSSGMYLRLAFAVAAHLETDILLLDEVLAVGDAAFQKKCLGRMSDIAAQGRTILFVSHNLSAVRALCQRAILIADGQVKERGDVDRVLSRYYSDYSDAGSGGRSRSWHETGDADTRPISMVHASVRPLNGTSDDPIDTATSFAVEWEFANADDGILIRPFLKVQDERGIVVFDQSSWDTEQPLAAGRHRTRCIIPANFLNDGSYFISIRFRKASEVVLNLPEVLRVDVLDSGEGRHNWFGKWEGIVRPRLDWSTEQSP